MEQHLNRLLHQYRRDQLANTKQQEYLEALKRNTDNSFYLNLVKLLELKLILIKDQIIRCIDDDEVKRLQGRGIELQDLISSLKRKPVKPQHTGSFN